MDQATGQIAGIGPPGEGEPVIGEFCLHQWQPAIGAALTPFAPELSRLGHHRLGVIEAGLGTFVALFQFFETEFANRGEDSIADTGPIVRRSIHKTFVNQRTQELERIGAGRGDSFNRFHTETARKDREVAEQPLFIGGEQSVTPGDGVAHGLLTNGQIAPTAGQNIQLLTETAEQIGGREEFDPGRSQFDRERQSVDRTADRGDRAQILGGQAEAVIGRVGALDKEADRIRLFVETNRQAGIDSASRQRRHDIFALTGETKPDLAGGEARQVGAAVKNDRQIARHVQDLFEIIEHQQDTLITNMRGNQIGER